MALLPILRFPDARLKKVAAPIVTIDESIRKLAADMAETMYEAPGIGLAATQVDVHKQLVVIDISEREERSAGPGQSEDRTQRRRPDRRRGLPFGSRHL